MEKKKKMGKKITNRNFQFWEKIVHGYRNCSYIVGNGSHGWMHSTRGQLKEIQIGFVQQRMADSLVVINFTSHREVLNAHRDKHNPTNPKHGCTPSYHHHNYHY